MSTVIEQPRSDVPIVADATLLAVPDAQDQHGRAEYLKKIRALRDAPAQADNTPQTTAPIPSQDAADLPAELPTQETLDYSLESSQDAIEQEPESATQDTPAARQRLSADDLKNYEIPVVNDDGTVEYLSYDEFNKTVGTYSKVNKKARELADREREVDAIKTQLVEANQAVLQNTNSEETQLQARYRWVQDSIAHAHKYGVEQVKFQDGTQRSVTQLIAEKTTLENRYVDLQNKRTVAQQTIEAAQQDFIQAQNEILKQRSPGTLKARNDIAKFLERSGFSGDDANTLSHAKAELLIVLDKAMKYDNALKSQNKEKRVGTSTKVLGQRSRQESRGVVGNSPQVTRIQELERLGMKANRDQLRELYRLKQGR